MKVDVRLGFACEEVETIAAFNSLNEYVGSLGDAFRCCEIISAHLACEEESLFKIALNKTELEGRVCCNFRNYCLFDFNLVEVCGELGNADLRCVVARDVRRCACADCVERVVCAEVSVLARYVCREEVKLFVPYERCRRLCRETDACFTFLVFVKVNVRLGFACEEVETVTAFNSFNVNVFSRHGVLCCCEIVAAHLACEEECLFKIALNETELEGGVCLDFLYNLYAACLRNCGNIVCKCYGFRLFAFFDRRRKLIAKLFFGSFVHFDCNRLVSGNDFDAVFGTCEHFCCPFNIKNFTADSYDTHALEGLECFFRGVFIHCIKILLCIFKRVNFICVGS